jgi:hypothetical protein
MEPPHEGFWVVTRHTDVADVSRDDATYSSQHDLGDGRAPAGYGGITIPAPPTRSFERIPDFAVTEDAKPYESIGIVNGWATTPATFTPGTKRGSTFRL